MNIKDLRNLTQKLCNYRMVNKLTYAEFCELADISHKDLVALQIGDYEKVPDSSVKKVRAVVCGP